MYNLDTNQVSAFDAKTHLSQLLVRVQQGSRITITKHNMPVAMLIPIQPFEQGIDEEIIEKILLTRKGRRLGKESIQELKEEGRR
jgi:prevent-host-death family protein